MSLRSTYITKIICLIFCCFLVTSCNNQTQPSKTKKQFKTLPEIRKSSEKKSSFSEQVAKIRKQTEIIDDKTENMLNRHKKWFALGIIVFLWLAFQSLINYRQDYKD